MEVGVLGALIVTDGTQEIETGGARLRALLIRLAVDAGTWVGAGDLVDALWEDNPPGDATNSLQSLVSRLRRALPAAELIESGPAGYRLAIDAEAVDALRFEHLAGQARRLLQDDRSAAAEQASVLLETAIALWRGPPLAEVAQARYALASIQQLEKLRLTAIDSWATAGLRLGRHPELIAELEKVVEQHPLRESTHELLIRALAGSGRQQEALAVYGRFSRRLAEELGLDPPAQLQQLQTAVLRNEVVPAATTDRPVLAARRTNLRSPLTSFVGRDDEVAQIDSLFKFRTRLITLIGPGGAGKTRLAAEAMAQLSTLGSDGVWMVELAPVTDPEDVAPTVLGSIGVQDLHLLERQATTPRDALSRIVENLADHDVVVILDNCEHVLDQAAKLAGFLLGRCPRLLVLATSREPLGIVGESLCPVPPLPMPDPEATGPAALLTPALQLFLDRASLVKPGFAITAENAAAVTEICRRLDGLPLAIELASARLRHLTVEAIAARLGDRFRLLTSGNRTAMPRHQTLRAVVAWSWDLLTEPERALVERLSVFPGGVSAESAESVSGRAGVALGTSGLEPAVADLLLSLADKSLLVVVEPTGEDDGAEPRYRMLETIREYAAEQVDQRGDTASLRRAQARYFLQLAETAEPKLRSAEQLPWLDRLAAERDNLLSALRYAAEASDADTAVRLAAALTWYWTVTGRHDEAANLLEQALKVPGERPLEAALIAQVMLLTISAASGGTLPDPTAVDQIQAQVEGIELAARHPLLALVEPAVAALHDQGERGQRAVEQNLAHPDPWARAMLQLMSGMLAENDGDLETMQFRIPLALKGFREIGDRWGISASIGAMANVLSTHGDLEQAIEAMQEARELMVHLKATEDESHALTRIGLMRLRLGDAGAAARDIEAALEIAERSGSSSALSHGTFALAQLAHHQGRPGEAREQAATSLALLERSAVTAPQMRALIQCSAAIFDLADGRPAGVRPRLAAAYEAVKATRDMPIAAIITTSLADLMLVQATPEAAAELLGAGVRLRGTDDLGDPEVRRISAAARSALGPAEYERRHELGRNLSREAALALIEQNLAPP